MSHARHTDPTAGEARDAPSLQGRKAQASAETRSALLEVGAALLREEPVGSVLSQLTARSVAARAGRTTGAFFHQWRNQDAYQRDLLAYVLDSPRMESVVQARNAVLAGLATAGDPVQLLEDAARDNFRRLHAGPYLALWHALWAKHASDPYLHDLLRRQIDDLTAHVAAVLDAVVTASGRRFRPPFTLDSLAVAIMAVAQGLRLRVVIEPERVPMFPPRGGRQHAPDDGPCDLYATTVRTLFEAFTAPGDRLCRQHQRPGRP